jgi:RNase H-fold protein (predicted Holliday junction resolvase)
MRRTLKESPKVLGLDVSTKTIGWALFDIQSRELLELTHISPLPKPRQSMVNLLSQMRTI